MTNNSNDELLNLLKEHKEYITTVREWDKYAKENGLPPSVTLIYRFSSWTQLKKLLGLNNNKKNLYDKDDLLKIAEEHSEYFTSKRKWSQYSNENNLPSETAYIYSFGSWNKAKERLNLSVVSTTKPLQYTKKDIEAVIKEHGKNLVNRTQWDEYAKKHQLPTYKTMRKHFTWEEILKLADIEKQRNYTKEDLRKIAVEHYDTFMYSSISKWNQYAKEQELPTSSVFIRNYGTWKQAKVDIMNNTQNKKH